MYDNQQPNQYPPQVPPAYGGPPPAQPPAQWQPMQREYMPPWQPAHTYQDLSYQYQPQPPAQYQAAPYRGVMKERKNTSHGLHVFLSIISCGMWAVFVWLPLTVWHAMGPRRKNVTRYR